ncbi:SulP family inorganic anion transporter [Yersinia ruckeri]|uniref:SulP family inorganic anion transporter n=1 Tax=Yersinia ruckeri TaxID=29486 RepID=UPI000BDF1FD1|nr:SulP family inorganic anion transporter [Yersinia ruckeri]MCK8539047.1 SulP family inorganic anion transporter [Yersinia ruckeri]MCK8571344.1 SulP family inorganic anion transporter [Yersinia ruckeri]MCK8574720.1 SulP family inorganic anion transporter [Yersinia ruckeri]MCK8578096.1 SulP family inorganic anion transporter [Yersinia ruckeri]MCK8581472.1 SulP family inorganic anion transporter [Yersinia ruckeri]
MLRKSVRYWMPGLTHLMTYERAWLKPDLRAGLSVAAVALPIAIAYAELTGVSAAVGLYSCILPMIAYAFFGSSRQLIVGPDAATCAVIAAVVAPLAMGNKEVHWQLTIMMTLMMGSWCLVASRFKLGALADLLSRPILTGLLNGVAITIIVDQLGKVFGFMTRSPQLIERVMALPHNLLHSHLPTVAIAALTFIILVGVKWLRPNWPAPLFAIVIATLVTWAANLQQFGVDAVGGFDGGLPIVHWPEFKPGLLRDMVIPALNLAVVSFVSMMLTARSFASKNGYEVDADAELRALGVTNIVSALSQGFAISGASTRTAVNNANHGKSQLVSIIAALAIAVVLFFLTAPLQFIPVAALGVILIYAAWSLLSFKSIWQLRKRNIQAFSLAIFTFISVVLVGVISGIGLAVLLGLLQFLRTVFRPTEQLLGVNSEGMIHSMGNNNGIKAVPGVMIYRFNSPLTYFNVAYFKRRILNLVDSTPHPADWVVIDAVASFTYADISVLAAVDELKRDLKQRNIKLVLAGRRTELTRWFRLNRLKSQDHDLILVPDLYLALKLIQSKQRVEERTESEQLESSS